MREQTWRLVRRRYQNCHSNNKFKILNSDIGNFNNNFSNVNLQDKTVTKVPRILTKLHN